MTLAVGGIEGQGGAAINIAYFAIVAFLLVLLAVVTRTAVMYLLLLILPLARLLRRVPGMSAALARLEHRLARLPGGGKR